MKTMPPDRPWCWNLPSLAQHQHPLHNAVSPLFQDRGAVAHQQSCFYCGSSPSIDDPSRCRESPGSGLRPRPPEATGNHQSPLTFPYRAVILATGSWLARRDSTETRLGQKQNSPERARSFGFFPSSNLDQTSFRRSSLTLLPTSPPHQWQDVSCHATLFHLLVASHLKLFPDPVTKVRSLGAH